MDENEINEYLDRRIHNISEIFRKKSPFQLSEKEYDELRDILKYDIKYKPRLNLKNLENTSIHLPTREIYDETLMIYESGNWTFKAEEPPLLIDYWKGNENLSILAEMIDYDGEGKKVMYSDKTRDLKEGTKVISLEDFCKIQNISPEKRKEINEYFKDRKYFRNFWEELEK